jgi:Ran GTPase-activating protein (RanGAP) involved in mRNA processing and transport
VYIATNDTHRFLHYRCWDLDTAINLPNYSITPTDLKVLNTFVQPSTKYITLARNPLDNAYTTVSTLVSICSPSLVHLDLSFCQLGSESIRAISMCMLHIRTLENLNLSGNNLIDVKKDGSGKANIGGVLSLFATLCSPRSSLKRVDLSSSQLFGWGFDEDTQSWRGSIQQGVMVALSNVLIHNKSLYHLSIESNFAGQGYRGVDGLLAPVSDANSMINILSEALTQNTTIRDLNIANIGIDMSGSAIVAASLSKNKVLKYVNVSRNRIGVKGIEYFCTMIQSSTTIQALDISGNDLSDAGVAAVAQAIRYNESLTDVDLSYNAASKIEVGIVIGKALSNIYSNLIRLSLKGNNLDYRAILHIVDGLSSNDNLVHLDLSQNKTFQFWSDEVCLNFALAVSKSMKSGKYEKVMHRLDLSGNNMTRAAIKALTKSNELIDNYYIL